jgi:hypothetical protein
VPPDFITDRTDVALLAQDILNPTRDHLIVLLTIPQNEYQPVVRAPELEAAAGPDSRIYVIGTGRLTRELEQLLPNASAFGGACRVYPPGTEPAATRLLLPTAGSADLRKQLEEELEKAHRAAAAARRTPPAPRHTRGQHAGAGRPSGGIRVVSSELEADSLGHHVLSPARSMPVVVVSRAVGEPRAFVDTTALAADLFGLAEVYEMPTGPVTWAFSARLPEQTDVYGGASRVYPVDLGWRSDPYRSPLLFAFPGDDTEARTAEVISAALRFVRAVKVTGQPSARRIPVEAEVIGTIAARGMAQVRAGAGTGTATIWPELIADGVPAERLLRPGMQVQGLLDLDSRRLDVAIEKLDPAKALPAYQPGEVVLGLVHAVERELCFIALHRDVIAAVAADEVVDNPTEADLRELLSVGEVVTARIVHRGLADDDWGLSLLGTDQDPLPAPSILPGGPPWLVLPPPDARQNPLEDTPAGPPEAPAQETVRNLVADPMQVEALVRERDRLHDQLRRREGRERKLKHELEQAKSARRRAEQATRAIRKELAAIDDTARVGAGDDALFGDPEEQFRFEVDLAWARLIPPSDKPNRPRGPWRIGPDFLDTLDTVQGIERAKVVEVIVEVITGLVAGIAGRELHQLREGTGGNTRQRVRADGAKAWRVSLQSHTPSARRLHYWQLPDGAIELSSVRLHDDFEP